MTKERALELLNEIIEYTLIAENRKEAIRELINMGFKPEELIRVFNFNTSDFSEMWT